MFCYMQLLLIVLVDLNVVISQDNNVCGTFKDYYTMKSNDRCWYDVAAEGTMQTIIETSGYPFEDHELTTSDGYILTMQRIPNTNHPNPKDNPVFIQHGLLADGSCFVGLGNNSLAFVLANAGYDVWLGNYRGTIKSEKHVHLTVNDKKYWDHGLDELALIDIPTMLNYIREKTERKQKILYIGHSMGTTLAIIYSSAMPDHAKENVKLFVLMAPAYKLTNMISPFRTIIPFSETILEFITQYDMERFVSQGSQQKTLLRMFCMENPKVMQLCLQVFNQFYGPATQTGIESVPVLYNLVPAGVSIKVIKHISDFVRDKFQKYDYGLRNREVYGQLTPPEYKINNIEVPIYVMYAVNDWAISKQDATNFYYSLPKRIRYGLYEIGVDFNHLDFLFGRYAKKLAYNQILRVFDRIEQESL